MSKSTIETIARVLIAILSALAGSATTAALML